MKKLLKGGTVVSGGGSVLADVVWTGEKVPPWGMPREMESCGADAQLWTFPAACCFRDLRRPHPFDLHVAGTVTADDFETGTKAAIRGGTTSIIDLEPSIRGRAWPRAWPTGMKRQMGNATATMDFICPSPTGILR